MWRTFDRASPDRSAIAWRHAVGYPAGSKSPSLREAADGVADVDWRFESDQLTSWVRLNATVHRFAEPVRELWRLTIERRSTSVHGSCAAARARSSWTTRSTYSPRLLILLRQLHGRRSSTSHGRGDSPSSARTTECWIAGRGAAAGE